MLTIGRALMTNPDLLILDEATEGLAPLIAREIWRIIGDDPRARHRDADRRQELRGGHGDRRPQRDPGQGPRRVRRRQRGAARAAGAPAPASRGLTCRSSTAASHRIEYERIDVAADRPSDAGLPARGAGLGRDVARLSRAASRTRPAATPLVYSRYGYGNSDPLRSRATSATCTTRRSIALPELLDRLGDRAADPGRAQRRRLDRADPCGRRHAAAVAASSRWRRTCWSRTFRSRASPPRRWPTRRPICARSSRAITPTSTRRSGAGTGSGSHPDFRDWNIEEYLPRIACPVLAIQGEDDEYGTMEQMRRIGAQVARRRAARRSRIAAIRRIATSRTRCSRRSRASSTGSRPERRCRQSTIAED